MGAAEGQNPKLPDWQPARKMSRRLAINGGIFAYCLVLSALYLLICTRTSPLYPFNDWVDANAFFTMGKGMMTGQVLYRDLFEQKGPLLYFIHGLSYLISHVTFLGVFLFEVLSFAFFLWACAKTIMLFSDMKVALAALPAMAAMILNTVSFASGDSAEEFCLPFFAISLHTLLRYFKETYPAPIGYRPLLASGIAAGCVLWIKFSMLGFWFGWIFAVVVCMVANRHYRQAMKGMLVFISGMVIATVPWFVYFGANRSIAEWIDTYIVLNVIVYPDQMPLAERALSAANSIYTAAGRNLLTSLPILLGMLAFTMTGKFVRSPLARILLVLCSLFSILGVYGGGRAYKYYFLFFSPLVVLVFIVASKIIDQKWKGRITLRQSIAGALAVVLLTLPLTYLLNHNAYFMKVHRNQLVQYRYAALIHRTSQATLLNYGFLDGGFYTAAGITPSLRFFQTQNISYARFPLILDEQNRYIREKLIDYVVIRQGVSHDPYKVDVPFLAENYTLVAQDLQDDDHVQFRFLLYRRK